MSIVYGPLMMNIGGGQGFPDGWNESVTAQAAEAITKYDPIVRQEFSSWDKQIDKVPNPAVLPTGTGASVTFSPDSIYMAVAHDTSPFITIYKRSGDTFTKLANPAVLPTNSGRSVAFSPDSVYMAVGHSVSPFLTIYKRDGDVFIKLANPAVLPPDQVYGVAFSLDDVYMAVAHFTPPFLTIYKRDGDVFTKLANPSVLPGGYGLSVAFSPTGNYIATSHGGHPFITIYKRSGDTFTKLANPSALPTDAGSSVAFSPDSIYMAVAHSNSPFIAIYKRDGDVFTKLPNPAVLPTSHGRGISFSPDGVYMAVAHDVSPYITIYKRDGDTFTKLPNPAVLPTGEGHGISFSPDGGTMAVAHTGSPYASIYRTELKDIIINASKQTTSFPPVPVSSFGVAMSNAAVGESCNVNIFTALNEMPLTVLPVGALVCDPGTTYYGAPIVWRIADKNHSGYPSGAITFITERAIACRAFDAKEPSNSNADRKNYGNNRYLHSNVRKWLNSDAGAGAWYAAQHAADQAPNSTSVVSSNPYSGDVGFLNGFSAQFRAAMMETTLTVAKNTVTDGGGSKTLADKMFLASTTEVGLANENGIAEGSKLALFSTDASRVGYVTAEGIADSDDGSKPANNNTGWYWWLRTPYASYSHGARFVHSGGTLDGPHAYFGYCGVRPLCNIPESTRVFRSPNADGVYILSFGGVKA